jgi:GcrA cell cycle regulator
MATRNAVIGKVHRLGLAGRAAPSRPVPRMIALTARPKPVLVQPRPVDPVPGAQRPVSIEAAPALRSSAPVGGSGSGPVPPTPESPLLRRRATNSGDLLSVHELTNHTCKWPIGDPDDPDFGFCGMRSEAGLPYCSEHAAIAYQQQTDRRPGEPKREDRAAAEVRRLARLANF